MKKLLFLSFLFFTAHIQAKTCESIEAGIDIGSGSIKLLIAKIDKCQMEIKGILVKDSKAVDFNSDFLKSPKGEISQELILKAEEILAEYKKQALQNKAKTVSAAATSVFRKARNGKTIISTWQKKLKIKRMMVISQEEEAELGMKSVLTQLPQDLRDLSRIVVWDIGGGSMQLLGYDQQKQKHLYTGDLASVSFKNMVMEALQFKNMETEKTPNPISDKKESAFLLAKSYAKIHIPQIVKDMIKEKVVIGIGGVHQYSIRNQIGTKNDFYTLAEVKAAALIQSTKKDEELTGDYRSTDVTNLFLVSGFMEALGIDKVQVKSASLLEGLLFQ